MSVFIIAEAGVNHNGNLGLALDMVKVAADAGADAIKFQTFQANKLVTPSAPKADYQIRNTNPAESQQAMLGALELDDAAHRALHERCAELGIEFMSTPFDEPSLDLLANVIKVKRLKIGSGDVTNASLLAAAAATGLPLILSTGMSVLDDVAGALGILCCVYDGAPMPRTPQEAARIGGSAKAKETLRDHVILLQCTSEYPTDPRHVNLLSMDTLAAVFGLQVGLSDHTQGIAVSLAAAARGAVVLEKHFTLDRTLPGPDQAASLAPDELHALIRGVRDIERALGSSDKRPSESEKATAKIARRSLVAARPITQGELFTVENIIAKRPGTGLSPLFLWSILGQPAGRSYKTDSPIDMDEVPR